MWFRFFPDGITLVERTITVPQMIRYCANNREGTPGGAGAARRVVAFNAFRGVYDLSVRVPSPEFARAMRDCLRQEKNRES